MTALTKTGACTARVSFDANKEHGCRKTWTMAKKN